MKCRCTRVAWVDRRVQSLLPTQCRPRGMTMPFIERNLRQRDVIPTWNVDRGSFLPRRLEWHREHAECRYVRKPKLWAMMMRVITLGRGIWSVARVWMKSDNPPNCDVCVCACVWVCVCVFVCCR